MTDADFILLGEEESDAAGSAISIGGDLDGDGTHDVVVGAKRSHSFPGSRRGRVYVMSHLTPGIQSLEMADAILVGEGDGDRTGETVDSRGDADGDGIDDLLVGASGWSKDTGRAYLVLGPVVGEQEGDYSTSPGGLADLDGDGRDDLLVVSERNDGTISDGGAAYVVRGPILGTEDLSEADAVRTGFDWHEYFGSDAAAADLDGDGQDDLVVTAAGTLDPELVPVGAAYVEFGPVAGEASALDMDFRILSPPNDDGYPVLGVRADVAGDLDGDGRADLAIGISGDDSTAHNAGAVYVFLGTSL